MTKLNAADLMVIVDTLYHSLKIGNQGGSFKRETREHVMEVVIEVMNTMDVEIVYGKVEPVVVSGDVGG
jgi:hypothetical protein